MAGPFNGMGFAAYQPGSASATAKSLVQSSSSGQSGAVNLVGLGVIVAILIAMEYWRPK